MKKTSYTPGPWQVSGRYVLADIREKIGKVVCLVRGADTSRDEANRRLIAAAPDLLTSLMECAELMKHDGFGCPFDKDEAPALDRALAVIAKARGQ